MLLLLFMQYSRPIIFAYNVLVCYKPYLNLSASIGHLYSWGTSIHGGDCYMMGICVCGVLVIDGYLHP